MGPWDVGYQDGADPVFGDDVDFGRVVLASARAVERFEAGRARRGNGAGRSGASGVSGVGAGSSGGGGGSTGDQGMLAAAAPRPSLPLARCASVGAVSSGEGMASAAEYTLVLPGRGVTRWRRGPLIGGGSLGKVGQRGGA